MALVNWYDNIWYQLPLNIYEGIFGKIPLPTVFVKRFKAVFEDDYPILQRRIISI